MLHRLHPEGAALVEFLLLGLGEHRQKPAQPAEHPLPLPVAGELLQHHIEIRELAGVQIGEPLHGLGVLPRDNIEQSHSQKNAVLGPGNALLGGQQGEPVQLPRRRGFRL
ncbi:hypothetical protein D3C75_834450 [compost metagenome]